MNNNSTLSLDVSSNSNTKVLRVYDTSFYYQDQTTDNYMLEVLPVNKEVWVPFYISQGFSVVLNSSNLRYKKVSDATGLIDLPDGIYEFKLSYNPNLLTISHFYHLRTTELSNSLHKEMSKLLGDKCSLSRHEYIVNRDKLRDIEEYLNAAKWMIEECGCDEREKGKELYLYSRKLLEQYTNECKC